MIEPRVSLLMVALFSQWIMTTVLMALFIDLNLCVICSAGLLAANADIAVRRLREELRWAEYQRMVVNTYDAAMSDMHDAQDSGSGVPCRKG